MKSWRTYKSWSLTVELVSLRNCAVQITQGALPPHRAPWPSQQTQKPLTLEPSGKCILGMHSVPNTSLAHPTSTSGLFPEGTGDKGGTGWTLQKAQHHLPVPETRIAGYAVVEISVGQSLLLVQHKFLQFHLHFRACHCTWNWKKKKKLKRGY